MLLASSEKPDPSSASRKSSRIDIAIHPGVVIALNATANASGGASLKPSAATVINSTITGNSALNGAGVWANNTTFVNSIVWGNTGDVDLRGNPSVSYTLVGGGYAGTGNLDTVPSFVDAEGGDFRLRANSPLIDGTSALSWAFLRNMRMRSGLTW